MSMSPFDTETISLPFTSKLPLSCGVASFDTSVKAVSLNSCITNISPLVAPDANTTDVPLVAV